MGEVVRDIFVAKKEYWRLLSKRAQMLSFDNKKEMLAKRFLDIL
jgi:hypothetical protein